MTLSPNISFSMTIDGRPVSGVAARAIIDPANDTVVAHAPVCSLGQLDDAVAAARAAFPGWAATSIETRQASLVRMAETLDANVELLATLITAEQGKPLSQARMEVQGAAWWARETAKMTLPETRNEDSATRLSITRHVPLGVVAAITPWNYPIGQTGFKVGPALLAGNTVVLKPSVFTPLATLKMGELLRDVFPPGVLNVVAGDDELGPAMTVHPGIDKVSFTGSTVTGRKVMAGAAATLKRITLELGGNDPAIVLPDADVETVAEKIFWTAFSNAGQVCLAAKRVYVHDSLYDAFAKALVAYARRVVVGPGELDDVQIGPVSNRPQYERVLGLVQDARKNGYHFLLGGETHAGPGYFVPLTIIDNPPENSRIVQEEQFGPILPLLRYTDIDDAVSRANAVEYGLGASVWSSNAEAAAEIGARLNAGTVWVNESLHLSPTVTFGGLKQSGLGSESGMAGVLAFTAPKTSVIRR